MTDLDREQLRRDCSDALEALLRTPERSSRLAPTGGDPGGGAPSVLAVRDETAMLTAERRRTARIGNSGAFETATEEAAGGLR